MKRLLVTLTVGSALLVSLVAHGEEKTGILVDARCGAEIAAETSAAEAHSVACALANREGGFGIIADGKFLRFDDYGNKQALLILKATPKKSSLKVRVGGHFEGDLIKVSEIETVE